MNVVPAWALLGDAPPEPLKMMQKIEVQIATKGPRRDQFERQGSMARRMLADGKYPDAWSREELLTLARELGSDDYWGEELDIVTTTHTTPTHDETDKFKAGIIVGKAFLWSFPKGKVICAGPVLATNQEQIKLTVSTDRKGEQQHQRLSDDLKNQAYRAALDVLRAVPNTN
jgi:hypothetical protein